MAEAETRVMDRDISRHRFTAQMREHMRTMLLGFLATCVLAAICPREVEAAFHLAVIDEVMASYSGDSSSQFVEIRMLSGGQGVVGGSKLSVFDADGNFSSVVLTVPSGVTGGADRRWIMGTAQFAADSGLTPDFTFSGGLPTDGGMVCWGKPGNETVPSQYVDCVAYGAYIGPTNPHIGTPTSLTPVGHSLVRVTDTGDNAADFACADPATPENNAFETVNLDATTSCTSDFTNEWDGASGLFPDQVSPAWTGFDSAEPEQPELDGGVLTLSSSENLEHMYYIQEAPQIDVTLPFALETRMRFVSGSSAASNRAPGFIAVTTDVQEGVALFIDQDEMFVTTNGDVVGDSAVVDTDDAFHNYRIEIESDGSVTVLYDGVPTLSGATFVSNSNHGPVDRVFWGEGSIHTFGVLQWQFVRHTALFPTTTTTTTTTTSTTTTSTSTSTTVPVSICGDANVDTLFTATDALLILQSAVGQPHDCPPERCDVDNSGAVVASDALRVLQFAVGLDVELDCPAA